MIENPVRSPMVPPIAESISTNFAALSFLILSNVGVSKNILTYLKYLGLGSIEVPRKKVMYNIIIIKYEKNVE